MNTVVKIRKIAFNLRKRMSKKSECNFDEIPGIAVEESSESSVKKGIQNKGFRAIEEPVINKATEPCEDVDLSNYWEFMTEEFSISEGSEANADLTDAEIINVLRDIVKICANASPVTCPTASEVLQMLKMKKGSEENQEIPEI